MDDLALIEKDLGLFSVINGAYNHIFTKENIQKQLCFKLIIL